MKMKWAPFVCLLASLLTTESAQAVAGLSRTTAAGTRQLERAALSSHGRRLQSSSDELAATVSHKSKHAKIGHHNSTTYSTPACCSSLLTPEILQHLGASSLDTLQLPVIIINTDNQDMTAAKNRIKGSMCICDLPGRLSYDWFPAKVGVRGSTSVKDFTRKSMAVTVEKPKGAAKNETSKKIEFLGMPKGSEWFLYAPEGDTAMIRNALAYKLWRQTGRWGPRSEWVEVFIIPTETTPITYPQAYFGLYMGGEKIWRDKHRVDIAKYDPHVDATGGYIFRIEHGKPKNVPEIDTIATSQIILIDEPRSNVSDASLNYLSSYFNAFEKQLLSPGLANYSAFVAPGSLVDWFLANELVKSANDGYRGSVYFWKDADSVCKAEDASSVASSSKLKHNRSSTVVGGEDYCLNGFARVVMGPVWDAAKAMGLCCGFPVEGYAAGGASTGTSGGSAISAEGWLFNICAQPQRCKIDPMNGLAQWYLALWRSQAFRSQALSRYQELRQAKWSDAWFLDQIDSQSSLIRSAVVRNWNRWAPAYAQDKVQLPPGVDGVTGWNISVSDLRAWIPNRLHWLDGALAQAAAEASPTASSPSSSPTTGNAMPVSG